MAIQFIMPGKVIMGERALDEAAGLLKELGTKALIVTDRVMAELGNVKILEEVLEREGLQYTVYDGVFGEPTDHMVEAGTGLYKTAGCDFLIALGGRKRAGYDESNCSFGDFGRKNHRYDGKRD